MTKYWDVKPKSWNLKRFLFSGEDYKPTLRDIMYFIVLVLLILISAIQL